MHIILFFAGIIFLIYFFCIAFFTGHGSNFYFIWLILGVAVLLFSVLMKKGFFETYVPFWVRKLFLGFVCLGMLIFFITEGCIVSGFFADGKENLDYLVVLGAQMKESGPSKSLQYRLDAAYDYLMENENTLIIVSGGKGSNEPVSEARGMCDYLMGKGIAPSRILLEDKSKNTFQNLNFSAEFLDREKDSVGIVSNNFHIYRAMGIARKAGYQNVCGIAARSELFLQVNNMVREFFGVVKDTVFGNM